MSKYDRILNGKTVDKPIKWCNKKRHTLYLAYHNIKARCENTKNPSYKHYGARGIKNLFKNYDEFWNWSIKNGWREGLEIDRIDNDCSYSAYNCRWVDRSVQNQNTRLLQKNNTSGYRGVTKSKNGKWIAQITFNSKHKFIGTFNTPIEAGIAFDEFVKRNGLNQPLNFNKYQRVIRGVDDCSFVLSDVYDVLKAFDVRCPALQHLIKKALCTGLRGHKTREQDLQDIIDSANRALELNKEDEDES